MNDIFVKTPTGVEEINKLNSNLSLRMRRILIHIDGKRSVEAIRALSLVDNLDQVLEQLRENGFITENTNTPKSGGNSGSEQNVTFREIPANPNPKDIERARTFMINTLRVFCGEWAHLSIIQAVSDAQTHEELRKSFNPWLEAIQETKDGKKRMTELSTSLLKDI